MFTRAKMILALAVIGLAGAPWVAKAQSVDATQFEGVTLRVATWGGATRDALRDHVASELERRGGKVEFVIGSPQDNLAKLITARGRVPFDVMEFLGTMRPEIVGRGLLEKIDMDNIPNGKAVRQKGLDDLMLPTWITEEMIIYNTEKFRENGIAPPRSLLDLRNPKLAGRVMIPDISSGGGIEALGAFALTAGGDEQNIQPGLDLMKEIPDLRFWKAGGQVVTQFKSGDIWAAVAHAGWALRTARADVPVATVPAKIGSHEGIVKEGYVGVTKGSPNKEAAEFFINTYLSAEAQYRFAEKVGVVPIDNEARARLSDSAQIRKLVVLEPARIEKMARLDPAKIDLSRWNEQWNRSVAR